jgi:antitoxin component YwqK of YwqJK toxin-antitoxin module
MRKIILRLFVIVIMASCEKNALPEKPDGIYVFEKDAYCETEYYEHDIVIASGGWNTTGSANRYFRKSDGAPITGTIFDYKDIQALLAWQGQGEQKTAQSIIPVEDGYIHGCLKYYENGKLRSETPYTAGRKDGTQKWYYENGAIKETVPFINGLEEGLRRQYYENGTVAGEIPYEHGTEEGTAAWYYENGKTKKTTLFRKGNKDGVSLLYYENGQIAAEIPYGGKKETGRKYYNEDGTLQAEIPYILKGGTAKYYDTDGSWFEVYCPAENVVFFEADYPPEFTLEARGYKKDGTLEFEAIIDAGMWRFVSGTMYENGTTRSFDEAKFAELNYRFIPVYYN